MVAPSAVIKKTARALMNGKFLRYIAVSSVPIFVTFCCMIISQSFLYARPMQYGYYFLMAVTAVFLLCPLYLGTLRVFWRMYMGVDDSPVAVFHYFTSKELYSRAFGLIRRMLLRLMGYGALFFLPAIVAGLLSSNKFYSFLDLEMPSVAANLWLVSDFLTVIAAVVLFFVMLRCYLAPFLLVADEEMEPAEAVHMSYIISKCTFADFIGLIFCFAHWILLSLLVLPLPATLPYMINAYLVHSRFATAKYNQAAERMNTDATPTYAVGF